MLPLLDSCHVEDSKGVSPLHMAAFEGRPNLVRLLLKTGADPNLRDRHGQLLSIERGVAT